MKYGPLLSLHRNASDVMERHVGHLREVRSNHQWAEIESRITLGCWVLMGSFIVYRTGCEYTGIDRFILVFLGFSHIVGYLFFVGGIDRGMK